MNTTITRRGLIGAVAGVAIATAQSNPEPSSPAQPVSAQTDLGRAIREQNQRAGEVLAKFEIPLSTEPAFQFKA